MEIKEISSFSESFKNEFLFLIYKINIFIKLLKLMINRFCFLIYVFIGVRVLTVLIKQKHLLIILISLEFIIVGLFLLIIVFFRVFNYEYYFRMLFLSVRVCERVLGLSIMVRLIRVYGNDYFQSFNILW